MINHFESLSKFAPLAFKSVTCTVKLMENVKKEAPKSKLAERGFPDRTIKLYLGFFLIFAIFFPAIMRINPSTRETLAGVVVGVLVSGLVVALCYHTFKGSLKLLVSKDYISPILINALIVTLALAVVAGVSLVAGDWTAIIRDAASTNSEGSTQSPLGAGLLLTVSLIMFFVSGFVANKIKSGALGEVARASQVISTLTLLTALGIIGHNLPQDQIIKLLTTGGSILVAAALLYEYLLSELSKPDAPKEVKS